MIFRWEYPTGENVKSHQRWGVCMCYICIHRLSGKNSKHAVSEKFFVMAGPLGAAGPMCNRKHYKIIHWKMIRSV